MEVLQIHIFTLFEGLLLFHAHFCNSPKFLAFSNSISQFSMKIKIPAAHRTQVAKAVDIA